MNRREFVRRSGAAGLVLAAPGILEACGATQESGTGRIGSKSKTAAATRGGTLTVLIPNADPNDIFDLKAVGTLATWTVGNIYGNLTQRKLLAEDGEAQPMLAQDWDSSRDGSVWTFRLHKGARFSDGSPVTSSDVAYSLRRLIDKNGGIPGGAAYTAFLRSSGISTPDPSTIRLRLLRPNFLLLNTVSARFGGILKEGASLSKPVASGPFSLSEYRPGQLAHMVRNEGYNVGGTPYLDELVFSYAPEIAARIAAVRTGNADVGQISVSTLRAVPSTGVQIVKALGGTVSPAVLDPRVSPYGKIAVRDAMRLAVDRQEILKIAFDGNGTVTYDIPILPTQPGYPTGLTVKHDPEASRAILKKAGLEGVTVSFLVSEGGSPSSPELGQLMAQTIQNAGFKPVIKQIPADTYYDGVEKGKAIVFNETTVQNLLQILAYYSGSDSKNYFGYSDPKLDRFVSQIPGIRNKDTRRQAFEDAFTRLYEVGTMVTPTSFDDPFIVSERVQNLEIDSTTGRFDTVSVKTKS